MRMYRENDNDNDSDSDSDSDNVAAFPVDNTTGLDASLSFTKEARVFIYLAYICLLFSCLVANSTVLVSIVSNPSLWSVTNVLIANLALGGLIMSVPLFMTPHEIIVQEWPWSEFMCKSFLAVSVIGVLITSFTLATLAAYRYATVLRLSTSRKSLWPAVCWCIFIWMTSIELATPLWINSGIMLDEVSNATICTEMWDSANMRAAYSWSILVLHFFCPAIIMSYCHIRIYFYLRNRTKLVLSRARYSMTVKKLENIRKRQRVHFILAMMVLSYLLTWLPWNTIYILVDQFPELLSESSGVIVVLVSHYFAMMSAVLNPFLYAFCRKECREKLVCSTVPKTKASRVKTSTNQLNMLGFISTQTCHQVHE